MLWSLRSVRKPIISLLSLFIGLTTDIWCGCCILWDAFSSFQECEQIPRRSFPVFAMDPTRAANQFKTCNGDCLKSLTHRIIESEWLYHSFTTVCHTRGENRISSEIPAGDRARDIPDTIAIRKIHGYCSSHDVLTESLKYKISETHFNSYLLWQFFGALKRPNEFLINPSMCVYQEIITIFNPIHVLISEATKQPPASKMGQSILKTQKICLLIWKAYRIC